MRRNGFALATLEPAERAILLRLTARLLATNYQATRAVWHCAAGEYKQTIAGLTITCRVDYGWAGVTIHRVYFHSWIAKWSQTSYILIKGSQADASKDLLLLKLTGEFD